MMGPVVAQYNTKYCRIQNTIVFCIRPYPPFSGPWCSGDTPFDKKKEKGNSFPNVGTRNEIPSLEPLSHLGMRQKIPRLLHRFDFYDESAPL